MNYQNEFDESSRGSFLANIGPKAAFFIVLIALSFMIGVVWKLYAGADGGIQNVPIVRADNDSFKVVPDDPGGMEIRHKDSTLFSSIKKEREEEGTRIENLLADDENEEPMPRSQLFAGLNTQPNPDLERDDAPTPLDQPVTNDDITISDKERQAVDKMVRQTDDSIVPPAPSADQEVRVVEEADEVKLDTVIKTQEPKEKSKPVIIPAPVEVTTKSVESVAKEQSEGNYYVQLASTKDQESADGEWKKLSQKYASIVGGMPHRIETADLGDKGVYYRIQVGPVDRKVAQSKCAEIKKITPAGCLVKK